MPRLRVIAASIAILTAAAGVTIAVQLHSDHLTAERNRKAAQSKITVDATNYSDALVKAFSRGPQTAASLRALGRGTALDYVNAQTQGDGVLVTFQMTTPYAAPPAWSSDVVTACYRDVLTKSGGSPTGRLESLPCTNLLPPSPTDTQISLN